MTHAVTNVGVVSIPESDITVADNVIGAVTQIIDKSDGDAVMAPGETWMYQATGRRLTCPARPTIRTRVPGHRRLHARDDHHVPEHGLHQHRPGDSVHDRIRSLQLPWSPPAALDETARMNRP
ncbi:MAG: hypothetical protein R3A10_12320 [Caldilineaceae bacterium]